jgi:hypothetical protein
MIQFAGTPALQEALRALCMEFNRYLHHSGATTSRKSEVNGYRHRSIEVGAFKLQAFSRDTIQSVIISQVDAQLKYGVIEESRTAHWSQVKSTD